MPLTALDPNTALLVVDLQKGIVGDPVRPEFAPVVARARALTDAFRAHRLPIILINVAGTAPGRTEAPPRRTGPVPEGFTDFVAEVGRQPGDIVVTKRTRGAFPTTDIEARLKALGVTQVVLVGVSTAAGVESTANQAYEAGFNVTFALDAMADARPEAHDYSTKNVFPRIGETGTAQDVIDLLAQRSA